MKKIFYYIAIFSFVSSTACSSDNNNTNDFAEYNSNLDCVSAQEVGGYTTFYKPNYGKVGDPMPFYNAADQTYYMYFLYENVNTHPIFMTKTKDFANYEGFQEALATGNSVAVDEWIGTGSFIKKGDTYYCFYTGDPSTDSKQFLLMATSTDLKTWTKQTAFQITAPSGYDSSNFRDPSVYFDSTLNTYVMLVASQKGGNGVILRYQSDNLSEWTLLEDMSNLDADGVKIFECPDIFQMGNKWYLVYSRINNDNQRKTFYRIADSSTGPWKKYTDANGKVQDTFDNLYFYAGKTVSDGTNRYITGWTSTGQTVNSSNELDWAGVMITHQLSQAADGRLTVGVPSAIPTKLSKSQELKELKKEGTVSGDVISYKVGAPNVNSYVVFPRFRETTRLSMTINPGTTTSQFGIAMGACGEQENTYKLSFDLTSNNQYNAPQIILSYQGNELTSNPMLLNDYSKLSIEIIVEKSVLTMYVNNEVAFTARIYTMNKNPWMIFSENGEVTFSNIQKYTN